MNSSRAHTLALGAVWLLILAYGLYFSDLSIQRHRAFLTNASDLGQIDQAIWNTLQGRPLEFTRRTGEQSVRLTDHVEPIFIPTSLVFLAYDNVEALLILQSFVIALGALPVFWIARRQLGAASGSAQEWAAVAFAALYLLFPALEAANLAEFHAVTFTPLFVLLMYHYGSQQAWGRFVLFALLTLAIKEEIALLVIVMGLWFAVRTEDERRKTEERHPERSEAQSKDGGERRWPALPRTLYPVPLLIAALALVWFVVTVFVIIPHYNTLGRSPYTCRYIAGEECREVVRGLFLQQRLGYLAQLLASSGWVALLDPVSLLLGAPLILANVLSNYPAQYSGTFHYPAPVVPYFVLAAIGGAAWLIRRWKRARFLPNKFGTALEMTIVRYPVTFVVVPVLLLALAYHVLAGYTPLARASARPTITAHNRLFARFAAQIPPDARVSTTSSLHPHLSHRRVLYRYPVVNDAEYVMLDVSDSDRGIPIDFRVKYDELVNGDFGVVDAADGYVLLRRGAPNKRLPAEFYAYFIAPDAQPEFPTRIDFADKVRLLGYDVRTDQYGRGVLRLYWQRLKALDTNYYLFPFFADAEGRPIEHLNFPSTVLFWYPSAAWTQNDIVVQTTLPLDWGPRIRIGLGVTEGSDWGDAAARLHPQVIAPPGLPVLDDDTWVELGIFEQQNGKYVRVQ